MKISCAWDKDPVDPQWRCTIRPEAEDLPLYEEWILGQEVEQAGPKLAERLGGEIAERAIEFFLLCREILDQVDCQRVRLTPRGIQADWISQIWEWPLLDENTMRLDLPAARENLKLLLPLLSSPPDFTLERLNDYKWELPPIRFGYQEESLKHVPCLRLQVEGICVREIPPEAGWRGISRLLNKLIPLHQHLESSLAEAESWSASCSYARDHWVVRARFRPEGESKSVYRQTSGTLDAILLKHVQPPKPGSDQPELERGRQVEEELRAGIQAALGLAQVSQPEQDEIPF